MEMRASSASASQVMEREAASAATGLVGSGGR